MAFFPPHICFTREILHSIVDLHTDNVSQLLLTDESPDNEKLGSDDKHGKYCSF